MTRKSKHTDCLYHVTPARNLAAIATEGLVPQVGARSRRSGEIKPFVHCFTSFEDVETSLSNGMTQEFDAGERLAILAINLRPQGHMPDGCAYTVTLGPHLLWVLTDDIRAGCDFTALRDQDCVMLEDYVAAAPSEIPAVSR